MQKRDFHLKMGRQGANLFLLGLFIMTLTLIGALLFADEVPKSVKNIEGELKRLAQNSELVNAVKTSNKKTLSMNEIEELEEEWEGTWKEVGIVKTVLTNKTAKLLERFRDNFQPEDAVEEIFVMNKQGIIISSLEREEHYYWGDEEEFVKAYAGGRGAIHYGEVEFEEDALEYLIQVGIPIIDPATKRAIGVISFGVNLDALEEK